MITYDVNLCIGKDKPNKRVAVKCHDTGANLRVYLQVRRPGKYQDFFDSYNIPSDTTAVLNIVKPDKKYCIIDGKVESDNVFFSMQKHPQAFTVAGVSQAEVSLFGPDGRRITSATFDIDVPEECICGCDLESENYIDVMSEQIRAAIDAADRAQKVADDVIPVRGEDYWTEEDKNEIIKEVAAIIPEIDAVWEATKEYGVAGETVFIPEQKVTNGMWNGLIEPLEEGAVYAVEVNGILYRCECHNDGDGSLYLGNGSMFGNPNKVHNNEPFCIAWAIGAKGGFFYNDETLTDPIKIKIMDWLDEVYNKLPEEFLPDCALKADENGMFSWDKISDKPFTEDVGELLFSKTVTFDTDAAATTGVKVTGISMPMSDGAESWLEVNGEMLKCHFEQSGTMAGALYDATGNRWIRRQMGTFYIYAQTAGTYTYNLYGLSENIVLDHQYIPNNVARKNECVDFVLLKSSTEGSNKRFKLTVDDSGTISVTEI